MRVPLQLPPDVSGLVIRRAAAVEPFDLRWATATVTRSPLPSSKVWASTGRFLLSSKLGSTDGPGSRNRRRALPWPSCEIRPTLMASPPMTPVSMNAWFPNRTRRSGH